MYTSAISGDVAYATTTDSGIPFLCVPLWYDDRDVTLAAAKVVRSFCSLCAELAIPIACAAVGASEF